MLEHPGHSTLWRVAGLPYPGYGMDMFGGWTMPIIQQWFGHRAEKAAWLYIVGCDSTDLPDYPYLMAEPMHMVGTAGRRKDGSRVRPGERGFKPEITKAEREQTPPLLAHWLLEIARRCAPC